MLSKYKQRLRMAFSGSLGTSLIVDFFVVLYGGCCPLVYVPTHSDERVSPNLIYTMVRAFPIITLLRQCFDLFHSPFSLSYPPSTKSHLGEPPSPLACLCICQFPLRQTP
jgi:hypothetical protein